jgi:phosphoribosylformimino-5-aminoimidazole carboxamide ribotide isomerase
VNVVGVIDLRRGHAVHARGGVRRLYAPVQLPHRGEPGNALELARFYVGELGVGELYVADLDAIDLRTPQHALIDALLALGIPVWLDAGISGVDEALACAQRGVARIVVGSETLRAIDSLGDLASAVGGERLAFSLDLRGGNVLAPDGNLPHSAETIVARVAAAGFRAVIVLDLARVGSGKGIDVELLSRIRAGTPDITLLAGGGIAGPHDLRTAAAAGCDGVLVATALLDGRLTAADVRHARSRR